MKAMFRSQYHFSMLLMCIILIATFIPIFSTAQDRMGKGRVTGTVKDESGRPIEDVLITVQSLQSENTQIEGKSDNNGNFAVLGMATGQWKVTASKKGYASVSIDMNIRQLAANPPLSFTLQKLTASSALKADQESAKMFDKGNNLLDKGRYDEAIIAFEEFLAKYPELYQVHLNIGTCFLKKGELDKAEQEYKRVLDKTMEIHGDYKKDAATSFRAFSGLGEIYLKKEDIDTAQKYFSQALDISPEDEVAAHNVAEVNFSHGKVDEAIRYFEMATRIKKEWPKPYLKLGYAYLNKGDFAKSLEYFDRFIQMDPNNPEVPTVKNIMATVEKMRK